MRIEKDFIGELPIPEEALYGIHSMRALENFPDHTPFPLEWYKAMGWVKLAVFETYLDFKNAAEKRYGSQPPLPLLETEVVGKLCVAARNLAKGKWYDHFIVPAIQGGAGTSINMNVNEILANVTLENMGFQYGQYQHCDPVEHCNIYQSTNDVVPTALRLAVLAFLPKMEEAVNGLRGQMEELEKKSRSVIRVGYTQMQEAVPTTYSRLFSTYNEALSRDWWRISKCFERIKVVNLGGSAIGTTLTVPRYMVMEMTRKLQQLTGLPIARAENLSDATANQDDLVEVHGIMKALAVNLEKMANDLRLLGSDVMRNRALHLPQRQVGSSIMPGKVNPVIVEFVISAVHKVYANDGLIAGLCGQGCLELNAYLPTIGSALLESLRLLKGALDSMKNFLIKGLVIQDNFSQEAVMNSPSVTTILVPIIGYHKATLLAKEMKKTGGSVFEANERLALIDIEVLKELIQPDRLLREGFTLGDLEKIKSGLKG